MGTFSWSEYSYAIHYWAARLVTKHDELTDEQRATVRELLAAATSRRIQDETTYTNQVFRLLILGNGAGIALLATFMGAVAAAGNPIGDLAGPLWKFLLGAILGAGVYVPLMAVASQATTHNEKQTLAFLKGEIDLENLQGWGLNRAGRIVVRLLAFSSFIVFTWAVIQCIFIVKSL